MLTIRQGIAILAGLLLGGCDREPDNEPDPTINIEAHNCFPSCQSFSLSIKPDGTTAISVFRSSYYEGLISAATYEGVHRTNLGSAAYKELYDAIDNLEVEDLKQWTSRDPMRCADDRRPQLRIRSETQLEYLYVLYLSCPSHRDIALQIGNIAAGFSEGIVRLDKWPLDRILERQK